MRPYTDLPALAEIVLEESFVLGIHAEPTTFSFEIDFVLTPNHPDYVPPPTDERECFRKGSMRFVGVRRLVWVNQGVIAPAVDAAGEIDYGHIDTFAWDGEDFQLEGDWGRIELQASGVEIESAQS